ncbi:MAG: ABC transporter ATP-binding protein [Planctomycetota bacterium]
MTSLQVRGVSFEYSRNQPVIDQLSLKLVPGQMLVLLGGNGAGKTTLLKLLAGQLRPRRGCVSLDDRPIESWSRAEIAKRLTLMPQFELADTNFSVHEMVQLGRSVHRGWCMPFTSEDSQAVERAIKLTGIQSLRERPIKSLSGGQWRRAVLARSLAQESPILLLDEPTGGLDLRHQFECLQQIRSLVHQNQFIAVVTLHDLNHAAMFADRIAVIAKQKLFADGQPEEVLTEQTIGEAFEIEVSIVQDVVPGKPLVLPAEGMAGK